MYWRRKNKPGHPLSSHRAATVCIRSELVPLKRRYRSRAYGQGIRKSLARRDASGTSPNSPPSLSSARSTLSSHAYSVAIRICRSLWSLVHLIFVGPRFWDKDSRSPAVNGTSLGTGSKTPSSRPSRSPAFEILSSRGSSGAWPRRRRSETRASTRFVRLTGVTSGAVPEPSWMPHRRPFMYSYLVRAGDGSPGVSADPRIC